MDNYAFYILKVCLGISVFVIPYYLLLKSDTNLNLKRFFLIGGVIISFIFPLLALKQSGIFTVYNPVLDGPINFGNNTVISESIIESDSRHIINWHTLIFAIYVCGGCIFLFRNIFFFLKWNMIWKKSIKNGNIAYSQHDEIFAIFSRIFLPNRIQNTYEEKSILLHENAHIHQLHFIDLLIIEVTILLTWFNPFSWLLFFLVKENHEHLADRAVLSNGFDAANYRAQLFNQTLGVQVFSIAQQFNSSRTRKRFEMMNKSGSFVQGFVKTIILLPIILLFLGSAVAKDKTEEITKSSIIKRNIPDTKHPPSQILKDSSFKYSLENTVFIIDGVESSYEDFKNLKAPYKSRTYSGTSVEAKYGKGKWELVVADKIDTSSHIVEEFLFVTRKGYGNAELAIGIGDLEQTGWGAKGDAGIAFPLVDPKFYGGDPGKEFRKFVAENVLYPKEAIDKSIAGSIIVHFAVKPDGKIYNAELKKSSDPLLNNEALRVIKSSPVWTPGTYGETPVMVFYQLQIIFYLKKIQGK